MLFVERLGSARVDEKRNGVNVEEMWKEKNVEGMREENVASMRKMSRKLESMWEWGLGQIQERNRC